MRRIILVTIVLLGAIGTRQYLDWRNQPTYVTTPAYVPASWSEPKFALSPEIVRDAQALGIDRTGLVAAHAQIGDVSPCEAIGLVGHVVGCTDKNVVIVSAGLSQSSELVTLNYEYLHYVWHQLSDDQRNHYIAELGQLYHSSRGLDQAMKPYLNENGGDMDTFWDEMHSVVGTYMNDRELPADLLSHYTQVTPNRQILPSYF